MKAFHVMLPCCLADLSRMANFDIIVESDISIFLVPIFEWDIEELIRKIKANFFKYILKNEDTIEHKNEIRIYHNYCICD